MNVPLVRVETFEGTPLPMFVFKGRECWIATDVGRALGYGRDGRHLVTVMQKDWSDEMIEWQDFEVLSGEALQEFVNFATDGSSVANHDRWSAKVRHLLILYETGLNFVCIKTDKPLGKRLRRFLVERVMPALRRGTLPATAPDIADGRIAERFAAIEQRLAKLEGVRPTYTPTEVARLIGRPIATVHRWVKSEFLPSIVVGHRRIVTHATLRARGLLPDDPAPDMAPPPAAKARALPEASDGNAARDQLRSTLKELGFTPRQATQAVCALTEHLGVLPFEELLRKALAFLAPGRSVRSN